MKKFIVVIMALITIFSASVFAYALSPAEWEIVDYITNISHSNYNCSLVYHNTARPTPDMVNVSGAIGTQKTTYNVLLSMYETVSVNGANFVGNVLMGGVFHWYEYGGYCWIKYDVDNSTNTYWVGNYQGKILYCDALASETTYDVISIAGFNYYLTNRPPATYTTGYLGDLQITRAQLDDIYSLLKNGTSNSDIFYYYSASSYNGEWRYYLRCKVGDNSYQVCNSSGQLFYSVKDDGSSEDTGGGSVFDPTEVISAINSVYDAINSQGSRLANGLSQLTITANSISDSFSMHISNTLEGFSSINSQLTTLNGYFSDLSGLFPVQEEITLLGSNTRVAWDSADRITGVKTSGFNAGDLTVKTNPGPLIDESGYENVKLSPDTTEYRLYNDADGYRRIVAANEYEGTGSPIPQGTIFYFPFDDTLKSNIDDFTLTYSGTPAYAAGVNGNAFVYNGSNYLSSDTFPSEYVFANGSFTISVWLYITRLPSVSTYTYNFNIGTNTTYRVYFSIGQNGAVTYYSRSPDLYSIDGGNVVLNSWNHIAITCDGSTLYGFLNGNLDGTVNGVSVSGINGRFQLGNGVEAVKKDSMIDELIVVNGSALWTSSFNAQEEAIFTEIAKDYFLPCINQSIGLVFDDTLSKTLTPTDVNGNAITMGRLEDDFSEIYMDITTMQWYCHDPQTQTEILLSSANQQIMNDTIYVRQNYTMIPADQITADALQNLLPVDAPVYLDMPEGAKISITYDHYSGWFRAMYILMDKQNQLLNDLDIVNETIINVENTVVNISPDNDAYHIFYITKTDGTTESVGDAAKDAAVFVGDILSMFYRLVFEDALDNADILNDFESAYSNTEVVVW